MNMKVKACKHHSHEESLTERLASSLEKIRRSGLRVTSQRKDILSELLKSERPLSAEEVFSRQKKGSSDLATVFRSLAGMEEAGILQRHDLGDNIRRYEVNSENHHHHHFVRCRSCGSIEAFEGCNFERILEKLLGDKGYTQLQHTLEVLAVCPACK